MSPQHSSQPERQDGMRWFISNTHSHNALAPSGCLPFLRDGYISGSSSVVGHFLHQVLADLLEKLSKHTLSRVLPLREVSGDQNILTYFNLKNRPSINPSRGRSIRQGGRLGDTYRRYKHVIKHINQHGSLAGWSLPIIKQCITAKIL
jgi:hypothetical protein